MDTLKIAKRGVPSSTRANILRCAFLAPRSQTSPLGAAWREAGGVAGVRVNSCQE